MATPRYSTREDRSHITTIRHGSLDAYKHDRCNCPPCREINRVTNLRYEYDRALGRERTVPRYRIARRMEAMFFHGYTVTDIARAAGMKRNNLSELWKHDNLAKHSKKVFVRIDKAFKELSMKPIENPTPAQKKWQTIAKERNYVSALAWNDIDDPKERPRKRWYGNGG